MAWCRLVWARTLPAVTLFFLTLPTPSHPEQISHPPTPAKQVWLKSVYFVTSSQAMWHSQRALLPLAPAACSAWLFHPLHCTPKGAPKKPQEQIVIAKGGNSAKPVVSYSPLDYSRIIQTYPNKDAAYADLGVNSRVRGCAAKVVKSRPEFTIFCCKLFRQDPPCGWTAALFKVQQGYELRGRPDVSSSVHNESTPPLQSSRGFESLALKREVEKALSSTIAVPPRTAYRAQLLQNDPEPDVEEEALGEDEEVPHANTQLRWSQVQWLKKSLRSDTHFGDFFNH